jgi:hypothetical protein
MSHVGELEILRNLINRLVTHAYHELKERDIEVAWTKLHSYAEIRWSDTKSPISVKCDNSVVDWHEAAITGLLAHELSHPALKAHSISEKQTDMDVIGRGLGAYLGFERVTSGRYGDVIINKGRDRYLGYESIREQLDKYQKIQLDRLMESVRIKPQKCKLIHDSLIVNHPDRSFVSIGGYIFSSENIAPDADIKLVIRHSRTYIYADELLIGQLDDIL